MHVIGVGSTVLLKFVYEMSEGIGHLEKMCVSIFYEHTSSATLEANFFTHFMRAPLEF